MWQRIPTEENLRQRIIGIEIKILPDVPKIIPKVDLTGLLQNEILLNEIKK
jgi:hypothetical protein